MQWLVLSICVLVLFAVDSEMHSIGRIRSRAVVYFQAELESFFQNLHTYHVDACIWIQRSVTIVDTPLLHGMKYLTDYLNLKS